MVQHNYSEKQEDNKQSSNPSLIEWKPFNRYIRADEVLEALVEIPSSWQLTPLQNKNPNRPNWESEQLGHDEIFKLINEGENRISAKGNEYRAYYSGFGLITGNGLLAIDVDGWEAQKKLDDISNGDVPQTISWTSGKAGRYQLLFKVPDAYWDKFDNLSRWWIDCAEDTTTPEQLDFRYKGFQSCLPPSHHIETGQYQWINSPKDVDVAQLPEWCCTLLSEAIERGEGIKGTKSKKSSKKGKKTKPQGFGTKVVNSVNNDWERHKRGNACPVCGQEKNCRTNKHSGITHCRGRVSHPDYNDYKFLGTDMHGFDMFKQKNLKHIQSPSQSHQSQTVGFTDRNGETQELIVLDDKIRDHEIKKILSQLSLTDEHYQNLINRGFTDEQIKEVGYRSVNQWQKLSNVVNANLAGVNKDGSGLVTPDSGILIPVKNEKGLLVGWQLRKDNPEDGNKYIWSASEKSRSQRPTVKDSNQELPLAVWGNAREDGLVYLCESTGIKPYLASKRLNAPVIGASGNNFASSPNNLDRALKTLNAKKIVFFPDGGAIQNPNILRQNQKAVELLTNTLGYSTDNIYFAWWNQWNKKDGDVDEININQIKLLWDCDGFLETSNKECWKAETKQQYKNRKNFSFTNTIESRFLNLEHLPYKDENKVFFIKSPLGSGKTELIKKILECLKDYGTISLGNLNNLLIQSSERWGMNHLVSLEAEAKRQLKNKEITKADFEAKQEQIKELRKDTSSKVALCIDSLIHFNPEDFDGRIVILDETTALARHLLTSSTQISKQFEDSLELLKECLQRASKIFCMDGNMNDDVVNFISSLCSNKEVFKLENTYINPVEINFIDGCLKNGEVTKNDFTGLMQIGKEATAIFADTQKECQIFESFLKDYIPEENIFRIDGETSSEPPQQEFLKNPNKFILENNITHLICSPSVKEGVDINITNWFKRQVCIFRGILDVDSLVQMIFRIRDTSVKRDIFCQTHKQFKPAYKTAFWQTNIKARRELLTVDFIAKCQNSEPTTEEVLEYVDKIRNITTENPESILWGQLEAVDGYEQLCLRDCLKERLKSHGHSVTHSNLVKSFKKGHKQQKETVEVKQSERIYNRQPIGIDEETLEPNREETYEKLKEQTDLVSLDKVIREDIKKEWYQGLENSRVLGKDVWGADIIRYILNNKDLKFGNCFKRLFCLMNPEAGKILSNAKWDSYINEDNNIFLLNPEYSKVMALKKAGIENLLERDETGQGLWITQHSEVVQDFLNNCKGKEFKRNWGKCYTSSKQAMRFVNECLEYLGCWSESKAKKVEGKKTMVYQIKHPHYDVVTQNSKYGDINYYPLLFALTNIKLCRMVRSMILKKERVGATDKTVFRNLCEKMHETFAQWGISRLQHTHIFLNKKGFAVTPESSGDDYKLGVGIGAQDEYKNLPWDTSFPEDGLIKAKQQSSNYDKILSLVPFMESTVRYQKEDLTEPLGLAADSKEINYLIDCGLIIQNPDGYLQKPDDNENNPIWKELWFIEFVEFVNATYIPLKDRLTTVRSTLHEWGYKWWQEVKLYIKDNSIIHAVES